MAGKKSVDVEPTPAQNEISNTQFDGPDPKEGIYRDTALSAQYGRTHRGLSPRHVQLMAIGGAIGIGLWVSPSYFSP